MQRFKRQFPICFLAGAILTLWTLITAAQATVDRAALQGRIATQQLAVSRLETQWRDLQAGQLRISELDRQSQSLLSGLAGVADADRLVAQLRQIAEINSLSVESMRTVASASVGQATLRTLSFKFRGGFNGFYAGLLQIETLSPSLGISDLRLDRINQNNAELTGELSLRLLLRPERLPASSRVSP